MARQLVLLLLSGHCVSRATSLRRRGQSSSIIMMSTTIIILFVSVIIIIIIAIVDATVTVTVRGLFVIVVAIPVLAHTSPRIRIRARGHHGENSGAKRVRGHRTLPLLHGPPVRRLVLALPRRSGGRGQARQAHRLSGCWWLGGRFRRGSKNRWHRACLL